MDSNEELMKDLSIDTLKIIQCLNMLMESKTLHDFAEERGISCDTCVRSIDCEHVREDDDIEFCSKFRMPNGE